MANVLLIAPTCDGDDVGEAWVAYQWARNLSERHDVTLLTYHKRGRAPARDQVTAARVIEWTEPPLLGRAERLNSLMKPAYAAFYVRARRWIRRAIDEGERFDVAHQPVPVAMRYPSPAAGLGVPLLMGPVGGGLPSPAGFAEGGDTAPWYVRLRALDRWRLRHDLWLRRTYEGADCVLGIADYVRDNLSGLDIKRFEVMSETALEQLPDRVDRGGRRGPLRLLYVGRLVRTKGAREIVRALGLVSDLDLTLDIVGAGPELAACEAIAAELGLGDRVTFFGARSRAEVADHYRAADVFVFPSFREPGGNVVFEAMGYGLPLIVADRGGPGSATDDSCAFRLPVTTAEAMVAGIAASVRSLATDPGLRLRMGAAGRARVQERALWSTKAESVGEIYSSISSTPPPIRPSVDPSS